MSRHGSKKKEPVKLHYMVPAGSSGLKVLCGARGVTSTLFSLTNVTCTKCLHLAELRKNRFK